MKEKLDLPTLKKAIDSFGKVLERYASNDDDVLRDSVIQRFEYCYGVSAKMIVCYLSKVMPDANGVKEMTFSEQIREAHTRGVLKNSWDEWKGYRDSQ